MNSFNEISSFDYSDQLRKKINREIESKPKEYILGIDENEFISYLLEKYTLEPLAIIWETENIEKPTSSKELFESRLHGETFERDVYKFHIHYNFSGSANLFRVRPPTFLYISYEILVSEHNSTVSFAFKINQLDKGVFDSAKQKAIQGSFSNIENVNAFATQWNNGLKNYVVQTFQNTKAKYKSENDFFLAVNIPVDKATESLFTAPIVAKKVIPQPSLNKNQEFSMEPTLSSKMYSDILKVINDAGKSMERKPSLYMGKDEEGLRDQFIFILETRYVSVTATGETFNRSGKTDILLKYSSDGSNLFVAECKFWTGAKGFKETIDQLFNRYLTWRDSKVAVIMFVKNNDIGNVIKTVREETSKHPYFYKDNGQKEDSSFSYIFYLRDDHSKYIQLEVLIFHFDKL